MEKNQNIIVIGASAGGIAATSTLVASFPVELDAAVLITIHLARESRAAIILSQFQKLTKLSCVLPTDGEPLMNGTVYLAPADHHMLLVAGRILINRGPYENHWRPSIDVLFRSAAASYGSCVTGIILTGLMDDGTSGMEAIKKAGGTVIVQDPAEAEYNDMPINVIQQIDVEHIVPINEMVALIERKYAKGQCEINNIPDDVKLEAEITIRMSSEVDELQKIAEPTVLTCPDCGGTLMQIKGERQNRFRCYTGHSFSEQSLATAQLEGLENSLWVAIRMMEERRNLLSGTQSYQRETRQERDTEMDVHIKRLKHTLQSLASQSDDQSSAKQNLADDV